MKYIVRCQYLEIYNDIFYDLLADRDNLGTALIIGEQDSSPAKTTKKGLSRQSSLGGKKEFVIKGGKECVVESFEECLNILKKGEINRHYAATKMNHHSSRSHTVFRVHIQSIVQGTSEDETGESEENDGDMDEVGLTRQSVLNFIDLAGSEKVSNHFNQLASSGIGASTA